MWLVEVRDVASLEEAIGVVAEVSRTRVGATRVQVADGRIEVEIPDLAAAESLIAALGGRRACIRPQRQSPSLAGLTEREKELLARLGAGDQLKEAARAMGIKPATAREYWLRIKQKWAVRSMAQAVMLHTLQAYGRPAQGKWRDEITDP
jgi:DNA-binding CsgD family transcriptional regulator